MSDSSSSIGSLSARLFGEERPRDMWLLLALLAITLHVWLFVRMTKHDEVAQLPKANEIVVEMITLAKPKPPVAAPPKPTPPPPQKKPLPKKVVLPPRPVALKPPPEIQQKAPDFAPELQYKPEPPAPIAEPPSTASPATAAPAASKSESSHAETVTEASYKANYLHNPKPAYPGIARSRGWTGKVLLKVRVTADGEADSVSVQESSGHEILDEAALDAVRQWKFVPCKRGDTPIACSVTVPMTFSLNQ